MMEEVLKRGINLIAGGSWDYKRFFCSKCMDSRSDIYNFVMLLCRERNRVLARKTRLRKKSFFEVRLERYRFSEISSTLHYGRDSHFSPPSVTSFVSNDVCVVQALQKQVAQLAVENDMLKGIVRQRLGGSKSASQVQNAPLNSAEVRTN